MDLVEIQAVSSLVTSYLREDWKLIETGRHISAKQGLTKLGSSNVAAQLKDIRRRRSEISAELEKSLLSSLSDAQQLRLRQIDIQLAGYLGIRYLILTGEISAGRDDIERVERIIEQTRTAMRLVAARFTRGELSKERFQAASESMTKRVYDEIIDGLSAEQAREYAEIIGNPLTFGQKDLSLRLRATRDSSHESGTPGSVPLPDPVHSDNSNDH